MSQIRVVFKVFNILTNSEVLTDYVMPREKLERLIQKMLQTVTSVTIYKVDDNTIKIDIPIISLLKLLSELV